MLPSDNIVSFVLSILNTFNKTPANTLFIDKSQLKFKANSNLKPIFTELQAHLNQFELLTQTAVYDIL